MAYEIPNNEDERLKTLYDLAILDTPSDPIFDELCISVAREFNTPVAIITLIDAERQWFKAKHGIDVCETSREHSFCNHVVVNDSVLIVADARQDPRFSANPYVTGPPYIRFYAGVPLYYGYNIRLGALCIIDQKPRLFSDDDVLLLQKLADRVVGEIWVKRFQQDVTP
jgi:GAF domain-containing protein